MNTIKHVVLTLAAKNLDRSLAFYKGVGISNATIIHGFLALELPGMSLFFASEADFTKYSGQASEAPYFPRVSAEGFLSCSVDTKQEVDDLLQKAKAAGGETFEPKTSVHNSGHTQYIGSFKDPDGHLWQLVCNVGKAGD
jgi:predicted lactoylglutathione lyase